MPKKVKEEQLNPARNVSPASNASPARRAMLSIAGGRSDAGWHSDAGGENKEVGYIKPREISQEMQESYLDYAMSVIVSRALPDVRDGLKPVHRRILYAMYDMGLRANVKFRKSATVVGETLGKYHPHGDIAVYDSLVRMAQDFSLRYPLVKGQGNFGSVDGDGAAAQRYTECKLSSIGEMMLNDIEKETVNFRDNYDATRQEPTVLPSPMPQLLLNGSFGIAVGMATSIPTHNAGEVLSSAIYLIDHPDAATEDLFEFFQGPDFPTGGIVYGKKDILLAYSQGKGPILTRGKADIEENKKGLSQIVITEIPFQVQKSTMVQQMAKLVEDKRVEGIKDIRDESDRDGLRVVIELKKEAYPKKVLNALYKYTDLQKTFHLNMLALVDGIQPRVLSLVDVLTFYLVHKKEVIIRRTRFDLQKAKDRAHILEGLMIALNNIDEVIQTIKKSESKEEAHQNLQKRFKLSAIQATAILEMRLSQLAKLERFKIERELAEIEKRIKDLAAILKSEEKIKEVMKKELLEMKAKYQDARRTKVMAGKIGEIGDEDLIPSEDALITVTQGGLIKRMKPSVYRSQKRGGKGVSGMDVAEEDLVEHFLKANTLDKLMFFTDSGKIFQCFVWEIPDLTKMSKGRGLLNFLDLSPQDKIFSLLSYNKKDEEAADRYLVMATKDGIIKKTLISAFKNVRRNGLLAIKMQVGDSLRSAKIADAGDEISLVTQNGMSIRFKELDVRGMGRGASGVKGIKISKGGDVVALDVIKKSKTDQYLLIVTENGYGKRTKVSEFRLQHRGGTGIKAAKINEKTGKIVFAKVLESEDKELLVISKKGQVIRSDIKFISVHGRSASGVRVMRMQSGDKVVSGICLLEEKTEEEVKK